MPPHRKRPRDPAQLAKFIVDVATGEIVEPQESPAATLGRRGGLKGGKARAAKMTPEQRREAAKKAIEARWRRSRNDS